MKMTRAIGCLAIAAGALLWAAGCGGDSEADGSGGSAGSGGASGAGATDGGGSGGSSGSAGASGSAGGGAGGSGGGTAAGRCGDPVPAGAPQAADAPAYSGGTCPTLAAGANTIQSSGNDRAFLLVLPSDMQPNEVLPVVFLWHWLGGDAQDFLDRGEVQPAVDAQRFIAVIPEKKGDVQFTWPATNLDSQQRVNEELVFFDDMLSCVSQQYSVNKNCVSSAGVSAGALWTTLLAGSRGDHLSSFISLSGGCGGIAAKPWGNPAHKMPALVLWGGPTDTCAGLLSFEDLSNTLEDELTSDGHFFLECIHNCGHAEPPFEAPGGAATKYQGLWGFAFDHPFWLGPGESPYLTEGLPNDVPTWCGIGKGGSTPRTGSCPNPSQC